MSDEHDYYGTKRVTAWVAAATDDPSGDEREGYGVRYADGYTSWSPKEAFEAAYKPITTMDFSGALVAMKDGHKVKRAAWPPEISMRWASGNGGAPGFWARVHGKDTHGMGYMAEVDVLADDWKIVD